MTELIVTCQKCKQVLVHECNANLQERITKLLTYAPGHYPGSVDKERLHKTPGYAIGDENEPFFSEAYLYNLMGKEDARTIRALLCNLIKAAGIKPPIF